MRQQYFGLTIILFLALLLSGCCEGKTYWADADQEVNVAPLYNLQLDINDAKNIPDVIDTSIFDFDKIDDPTTIDKVLLVILYDEKWDIKPKSNIDVMISLRDDVNSAQDDFNMTCNFMFGSSKGVKFGGEYGNQYCITPIGQLRHSPETLLCGPTGDYLSNVVFQKDRLVIEINETVYSETGKDLVSSKDAVIRRLAEELDK
jgi:hypothetical protein